MNLDHVLKYTYLPTLAGQTVALLVALVTALVVSTYNAWVLLIEIRR